MSLIGTCGRHSDPLCCEGFLPLSTDPFIKLLHPIEPISDTVNLQDDKPEIYLGPHFIEKEDDVIPPFYITLNVHGKLVHNYMPDFGSSHNLMPKRVMEELGLEITKAYHDLYSFDSKKVNCLGVIKDLVTTLAQLHVTSIVMDVIVANIPPKFGILLSRSWSKKSGSSLQLDMSYVAFPIFGGDHKRLY